MKNATKITRSKEEQKNRIIYIILGVSILFNLFMFTMLTNIQNEMTTIQHGITHLDEMLHHAFELPAD